MLDICTNRIVFLTWLSITAFLGGLGSAYAMEMKVVQWRGHLVVSAAGPVERGDAARLKSALDFVEPLPHGAKVVLLDSLGGSVDAALEISEFIDELEVEIHMVVPEGARCASACASLVLISGDYRTVEPGGLFGQHSCSRGGIADEVCNEELATHAFEHGVSHGAVAAFVTQVPPDDVLWFTREDLDCWGILRYPFGTESGFRKSEPCVFQILFGKYPDAQSAWRVDFLGNGYRAFLRPAADHMRELEVSLFCDENKPGELFLAMDIAGPPGIIEKAIREAYVGAEPVVLRAPKFHVVAVDEPYSRVIVGLGLQNTMQFLTKSTNLVFAFDLYPPYEPIVARTRLEESRRALIFAANNCIR